MSLYNLLFGMNPNTDVILSFIELKQNDIERFRDCGIDADSKKIWVYTRTGGNNREDYPNERLTSNPYYLYDQDDDFDDTYATYYFRFPEEIEQDILDFLDMRNNGISAKLIKWMDKTFNRPETENDKYTRIYKEQMRIIKELQQSMHVSKAFNGHTVVPLSDYGMEQMLRVIEKNNGEFIAYWNFLPYKLKIKQNEARWDMDKNKSELEQDQVRIGIDIVWEIDYGAWDRYKKKFGEKYPLSIKRMQEEIDRKR